MKKREMLLVRFGDDEPSKVYFTVGHIIAALEAKEEGETLRQAAERLSETPHEEGKVVKMRPMPKPAVPGKFGLMKCERCGAERAKVRRRQRFCSRACRLAFHQELVARLKREAAKNQGGDSC